MPRGAKSRVPPPAHMVPFFGSRAACVWPAQHVPTRTQSLRLGELHTDGCQQVLQECRQNMQCLLKKLAHPIPVELPLVLRVKSFLSGKP
jgi:hypothetical protein